VRESKSKKPRTVVVTTSAQSLLGDLRRSRETIHLDGTDRIFAWLPEEVRVFQSHCRRLFKQGGEAAALLEAATQTTRQMRGA